MRSDNLYELPKDLPRPGDDGACAHLPSLRLPAIPLVSTTGRSVDLSRLTGLTLILRDGVIEKRFYPVFPPNKNAEEVVTWLRASA